MRHGAKVLRVTVIAAVISVGWAHPGFADYASDLVEVSGVKGGLIVHAYCGKGELTAALRVNDRYMVHGLDLSQENVDAARAHVKSLGLYGNVSIDRWDGKQLPYIDNFVNLILSEQPLGVSQEEVLRVLTPKGVAYIKEADGWKRTVKPRPDEMDDWTHYLYDASNNPVSHDTLVGPPRHIQWMGSPRYSRHHDHMSALSAMVSENGRLFYIFDHADSMSIQLPSKWELVARDAFNGSVLWRKPIHDWFTQMYRLKSGPVQVTRRLVAVDDKVYVTLGYEAPVSILDAATGDLIQELRGSEKTEEIIVDGGQVFLQMAEKPFDQPTLPSDYLYEYQEGPRRIASYDIESGEKLWEYASKNALPSSLTTGLEQVLFNDGDHMTSLDRRTGEPMWTSEKLLRRDKLPSFFAPSVVLHEDVVLFSGGSETVDAKNAAGGDNTMYAISRKTGETLWTADHPSSGYKSPEDIIVMKGLVWIPENTFGNQSGGSVGRDPLTGEIKKDFTPDIDTHWFHHRCYRAKATVDYLIFSRTGTEFVDPDTEHWETNHWVRGACLYGIMPANGMIYNGPHPCSCYLEAKMYGFNALAPAAPTRPMPREVPAEGRLEKGPAYGKPAASEANPGDWPTYRGDMARSGANEMAVPTALTESWRADLGGKLTALTIAEGKVFVSAVNTHTVHALDEASGKPVWQFMAGGRVDSPPTVFNGRVYFGSVDGYVYCVTADAGELVWRFRAAPMDRRHMNMEQLESVWPVSGSVLIRDNELWTVAGRSMFVDGGLRLVRLNVETGELIGEKLFDDKAPGTDDNLQTLLSTLNMPVALNDILSYDGDYVYMRSQKFDAEGNRLELEVPNLDVKVRGEGPHLFSPTGFLDDEWWHRSYWVYGRTWKSGAGGYYQAGRVNPAGRPMVFDDDFVYGYGRLPEYYRWTTVLEYQLFAADKLPELVDDDEAKRDTQQRRRQGGSNLTGKPDGQIEFKWTSTLPLNVRAMALADSTLFMAGPPDVIDETETLRTFDKDDVQDSIKRQDQALKGELGAIMLAVSKSGERLAEWKLDSLPVFDALAAANGRLYYAAADGTVRCMAGTEAVATNN